MRFAVFVVLCMRAWLAAAVVVEEEVNIKGNYLEVVFAPNEGGTIGNLVHRGAVGNHAGAGGLLQEGFGVGSFYVPNRRLNEKLEILDTVPDRPVVTYSYDCDGPNIGGLHVTRTMEPLPDEASLRVTWRVENKGEEDQWAAPWVRNDLAPGGQVGEADRIDLPTLDGLRQADRVRQVSTSAPSLFHELSSVSRRRDATLPSEGGFQSLIWGGSPPPGLVYVLLRSSTECP